MNIKRQVSTIYDWLLDYQKTYDEIEYLEYKLYREKRELKRFTYGNLQKVKLNQKSIASGLEERIYDIEYELACKLNDQCDAKRLISSFKGLENRILYYKYVEGMQLNEVASELGYSESHIYKRHAEIMKRIDFAHIINCHFTVT